jgi:glycerol-3-phosphate dehydrogenase (NAD(P)+)
MGNQRSNAVAVLGAGCWGTALSLQLARTGARIRLWDYDPQHVATLAQTRANEKHVPGIPLPDSISPTADLAEAVSEADYILVAVASQGFRPTLEALDKALQTPSIRLIWATKGLEPQSGKFLHEVVEETLSRTASTAILSGPSFALEVARELPTAVTAASSDAAFAAEVAELFHSHYFRVYTSDDVLGVELGGSVKNVLAIAAGVADGLGFGANSRAALITRGLAEIMRLGLALGGRRETFMGLAGVGDLVLTCTDNQSRNRRLGLALGAGKALDDAMREIGQAVEGVHTASEVVHLARRHRVEMPIADQVDQVLYHGLAPLEAVEALMTRDLKAESV